MEPSEFRRARNAVWEAMAPGWEKRHGWFESGDGMELPAVSLVAAAARR
ncbi:MAG TPA: hypothetical protein VK285_07110 [Gaiellaceae bacterium]|nr:hypothetical protein [Gaiellaceae bacterium]